MTEPVSEKEIISNEFGAVGDQRIIYFNNKGWVRGGSREELPIKHVTSVRVDITRDYLWGGMLLLIGISPLFSGEPVALIATIFFGGLGILLLWGAPTVVVYSMGRDPCSAKGWPWQRDDAEAFARALRSQLVPGDEGHSLSV